MLGLTFDRLGIPYLVGGSVWGVLKVQGGTLEFEYLRRWADILEIRDLLERAIEAAGSPDRSR